jgi:pilus assembly protein CpaC
VNGPLFTLNQGAAARIPGAEDLPASNVISLLRVPGEQQVMLKVRIAELSRTALRDMGLDFRITKVDFSVSNFIGGAGNIAAILDGDDINLFLRAFSSKGNSKVLAEPTLVTLSGHTATFIAGGEFAVPQTIGIQGVAAATTFFRGFGTQLNFTPTVLDKDRVRLHVAPSFSTINNDNAVNGIPGLNTRAVATTVDLREGQWLAIAGLIQDEQQGDKGGLPILGDVPVLGSLFNRRSVRRSETELVVLVSPELVHPMEAEQVPLILPGVDVTEPTPAAFYLLNKIEGRPDVHFRSTIHENQKWAMHAARKDAFRESRQAAKAGGGFQRSQRFYMNGPQGFSD